MYWIYLQQEEAKRLEKERKKQQAEAEKAAKEAQKRIPPHNYLLRKQTNILNLMTRYVH